jgi:acylphosphatase
MQGRSGQSTKAVRAIVRGRVQGVWYRVYTERKARELGVFGHVRNLPDGSVEILAEGDPSGVDRLVEWTWTGSPHSSVTEVEVEDRTGAGLTSFDIRY